MQTQILGFLSPAITVIFTCVFVAIWWQDRSRLHILAYASWFGVVALATALQAFLITRFGPAEMLLLHGVLTSGTIALLWGVARSRNSKIPLTGLIGIALANGVVCWIAGTYENQMAFLISQNYNGSLLFALGAFSVWLTARRGFADRLLISAFAFAAAYGLLRPPLIVLMKSNMTIQEYQESSMITINMVINAIISLFLALALLASIFEAKLREQHREDSRDALSGLATRAEFERAAARLFAKANKDETNVFMIVADIDHFKRINDKWGHSAGDRVIAEFAALIGRSIRDTDICGRIGGEEFCVLVSNCRAENARNLADRLRADTELLFPKSADRHLAVTASFGIAGWRPGESYSKAFKRADAALYAAKNGGRNQVCTEDSLSRRENDQILSDESSPNVVSFAR